jgi:hypothetical protein
MSQSKVYVAQHVQKINYSPAQEYGELVFITHQDLVPSLDMQYDPTRETNSRVMSEIMLSLSEYIPGHDYLMMTGNPVVVLAIGKHLAQWGGNVKHKILKWNNRMLKYDIYVI